MLERQDVFDSLARKRVAALKPVLQDMRQAVQPGLFPMLPPKVNKDALRDVAGRYKLWFDESIEQLKDLFERTDMANAPDPHNTRAFAAQCGLDIGTADGFAQFYIGELFAGAIHQILVPNAEAGARSMPSKKVLNEYLTAFESMKTEVASLSSEALAATEALLAQITQRYNRGQSRSA